MATPKKENYETFFARVRPILSPDDLLDLDMAYNLAKFAHRWQFRKEPDPATGKRVRYFEHLRGVALILMDEVRCMEPQMIMAAQLPVRLRLLIPAVENSISGNAYRPLDVIRTRTVAATLFCKTGFEIGLPDPSTKPTVADGSVVSLTRTGGVSFCIPVVPAVSVNVCMFHLAAFPLWEAGVVAVMSIRAQPPTASGVPDVSETSTVRFVWFTTGVPQVPDEKAVAPALMLV